MIVSRQNALIKTIRSLSDKKNRDLLSLYVAEGIKTVTEALRTGQRFFALIYTDKAESVLDREVFSAAEKCEKVSDDVFSYVSGEVSPQGALAVLYKPETSLRSDGYSVFLDGVSDPANVGAIIRTAAAAGYNDVYLTDDCADAFNPKAVRASMSGIFRVNVIKGKREELIKSVKVPIVVADMKGENVFSVKNEDPVCIVIGNEGNGVSNTLKQKAAKTVSIPMAGGMESLNAAVSAGILMYNLKKL